MKQLITILVLISTLNIIATTTPPQLNKNSTIGVISTGFLVNPKNLSATKELKKLGFKLKKSKTLHSQYGYFSGTKKQRLTELHTFIADKKIDAIFHFRGGFGNAQLLDLLDYSLITSNPKIMMGYSDVTALLLAIYTKTGLTTYHGPMPKTGISKNESSYIKELLIKGKKITYKNNDTYPIKTITSGTASGILVGGNLSVITSLLGTPYLPKWEGKLLFIEDISEEVYKIDRMLTQLKLAGILDKVNGIIVGQFTEITSQTNHSFTLEEVLFNHLKPLGIPVYMNAQIGHVADQFILPIGQRATIDARQGFIIL